MDPIMEKEIQTVEQKKNIAPHNSPYWKKYDIEKKLKENGEWIILMTLQQEAMTSLNTISKGMYYLEHFYKSRYIDLSLKIYPELREETEDACIDTVVNWINERVVHEINNNENEKASICTYEIFKRDQKRKLSAMLNALIGNENSLELLKEGSNRLLFGILEFMFFSYLVDTKATQNGKLLRKKKYSYMTTDYYQCMKCGIYMLASIHPIICDPDKIVNMWKYDVKLAHDHLKEEIDKLIATINKAYDSAYTSNISKQNLALLSERVSSITKTIKKDFRI